ncbi:MAG: hypothetical protein ACRDY2_13205 [Acidimicrobiales bacterium]
MEYPDDDFEFPIGDIVDLILLDPSAADVFVTQVHGAVEPPASQELHDQVMQALHHHALAGESLLGAVERPDPGEATAPSLRELIWDALEEVGARKPGTPQFGLALDRLATAVKPHASVEVPEVEPQAWDPRIPQDLPDLYVRGAEPADAEPEVPRQRLPPPEDLFVSLEEQASNVRRWNAERSWGLSERQLDAIDLTPQSHDDPLVVDLLAVYLDDHDEMDAVRHTCRQLWQVAAARQPAAWSWDWYWDTWLGHPMPVRLAPGIEHRPGVRRVTVDLGAHWRPGHHTRPCNVRGPDSAHAEVLAAAAHFPAWVRAMDGTSVPFVWVSGYQVTMVERAAHRRLPTLAWSGFWGTLSFVAHWADYSQSTFASPTCAVAESVEHDGLLAVHQDPVG